MSISYLTKTKISSVVFFLSLTLSMQAVAQQQTPQVSAGTSKVPGAIEAAAGTQEISYRLGVGDTIELRVARHPELSRENIRIDNDGTVTIPRVEGTLQGACRTEHEIAAAVREQYSSFLQKPEIEVIVKEYNSQPVSIVGAVTSPGRFQLRRPARLLELLMLANGPSAAAGRTIQIVHSGDGPACRPQQKVIDGRDSGFTAYELTKTMQAEDGFNPYLQSGDIVRILEADQVYVIGSVKEPRAILMKQELTLTHALAMVNGVLPDSDTSRIRIVRQTGPAEHRELFVNLKAINKHEISDVSLLPDDVIEVPGARGGQKFLNGLMKTLVPSLNQLPYYVLR